MEAELTDAQRDLADQRAQTLVAATKELARRTDGFVSVRDTRQAATDACVPMTDWKVERDMVRAAGFGRFRTSALLGDWEVLVAAANEASRWYDTPIDLVEVCRWSLAWCLADQPDGPMRRVRDLSRDIVTDEIQIERPERPTYRQLLDLWRPLLTSGSGAMPHGDPL